MTYTYKCNDCNIGEFIIEKSMSDNSPVKCPDCNSENVNRVYKPITPIWKCNGAFGKSTK